MKDKSKKDMSEDQKRAAEEAATNEEIDANDQNETNENEADEGNSDADSSLSELEKKDLEIQALNDKFLRLYSEFDNFRRRTQKEKLELYETAGEEIFKNLLPVMDDFERAKKSMDEKQDYKSLKEGVDLIYNKLKSVFKANGAEAMDSVGEEFDSEIHEAITQVPAPSKKMKGKVVDEVEKGYKLKNKVIRFAKVVVGQ